MHYIRQVLALLNGSDTWSPTIFHPHIIAVVVNRELSSFVRPHPKLTDSRYLRKNHDGEKLNLFRYEVLAVRLDSLPSIRVNQ